MERIPVTSSNILSIGYDEESQCLEVEFLNMSVYQYLGVPPEVHESFVASSSKGSFFHQTIKHYPCNKL